MMTQSVTGLKESPIHSNGRLTVDLGAIVANWKHLAGMASQGNCAAVVKADAYGLGAERVGSALYEAGCREFFVATITEGALLRQAVGDAKIHVFNGFNPAAEEAYLQFNLTPVINSPTGIRDWTSRERPGQRAALHLETGINRLGLTGEELSWLANSPDIVQQLNPELVITHFACADDPKNPMNDRQIAAFREAADLFPQARKSMANSAGVFMGSKAHFDLLRPGISLYGGEAVNDVANPMRPVVRLQGRIVQKKTARKGETIGYGATHTLSRDSALAIVAIGYADGFHRALSGSGTPLRKAGIGAGAEAMIGDQRVPILGRVSMDMITLDVTDIGAEILARTEWVDLINETLPIDDLARSAGTIGYEILTSMGQRYERIYC